MRFILIILALFFLFGCKNAADNPGVIKSEIRNVLTKQEADWNNGSVEDYMTGYWQSDSLKFIGKRGVEYGWSKTLANYKKAYPDRKTMGKLKFTIVEVSVLSDTSGFVIGNWDLHRESDTVGGAFTLLFKKINSQWVIVCDHTS